jgi:putative peptidoglycan lipid II flippase
VGTVSLFRNILSVGGWTLVSRVTGFLRDILMAALLGAGPVADAFFVALRLPNHFRTLFAEGAFNAAFVPLFSSTLAGDGREAARRFAEDIQAVTLAVQIVLLAIVLMVMPKFMLVFAPGFADEPERFDLAVAFTRITFPYLLLMSQQTLFSGVLNSVGRFGAAAAAPILLNVFMIAALLLVAPWPEHTGTVLSWSVTAAGVAQVVMLGWALRRAGLRLRLRRPRLTEPVKRFLAVLGPVALGAGVTQLSVLADTFIASWLPAGAMSYIYYADRLNQLPLGVIGIAVGTVLLPEMTRRIKSGDTAGAVDSQNRAIEISLLLTLPATAAFLVAGLPIVSVLFQHGRFDAAAAAASTATLQAYAFGMPAVVVVRSLVSGFYARHDTTTPVRIAIVATLINIALKIALMGPLAQVGLAVATSAGAWINVALLAWTLHRRDLFRADARLARALPRALAATVALAVVVWAARLGLDPWLMTGPLAVRVAALTALCGLGAAVYAALLLVLGLARVSDLRRLRRRGRKGA